MPISADRLDALAVNVEFVASSIRLTLTDGRETSTPLARFPRLRDASDAERANWRLARPRRGRPLAGPRRGRIGQRIAGLADLS